MSLQHLIAVMVGVFVVIIAYYLGIEVFTAYWWLFIVISDAVIITLLGLISDYEG